MCRFAPLKADVIQPVCSKASDVGMLQAVDAFYVEVEPALQSTITKLQPVRAVFVTLVSRRPFDMRQWIAAIVLDGWLPVADVQADLPPSRLFSSGATGCGSA